jgi:Family of unknown function (DUF5689)
MKTQILKSVFFITLSSTLIISCVKDDNYDTPTLNNCNQTALNKTKEVSQIPANAIVSQYTADDVIEAYLVSSDVAGNIYKSLSFQTLDKSKAFSVPVELTSSFVNYQPGQKVFIKLKGLYTDVKYGGMRIGSLFGNSSGGAEVGRMPIEDIKNALIPSCSFVNENNLVQTVTISQALNDSYLNKLIEINDVQFSDEDLGTTYYDSNNDIGGATNHILMDVKGNTVIFRFSSYATFASKTIPSGTGKVRGIMTKYGSDYQFVVRTENDIKFGSNRTISTKLNESFSVNFGSWTKYSVVGAEVWSLSNVYGNPGFCAVMNGYNGGNKANQDWLISPSLSLNGLTEAYLNFESSTNYNGTMLSAYISNNYVSGDPNATGVLWIPLNAVATFAPLQSAFAWTKSGAIDLNATPFIAGSMIGNNNVRVAFKYLSTTSAANTWELDNIKVTGK